MVEKARELLPKYIQVLISKEKLEQIIQFWFDEAKDFIRRASFSETVWKGQFERYYSEDGAAYVRTSDAFIRTAFKREEYSDNILKALEIVRHGR